MKRFFRKLGTILSYLAMFAFLVFLIYTLFRRKRFVSALSVASLLVYGSIDEYRRFKNKTLINDDDRF